jgi:hypothetical protein
MEKLPPTDLHPSDPRKYNNGIRAKGLACRSRPGNEKAKSNDFRIGRIPNPNPKERPTDDTERAEKKLKDLPGSSLTAGAIAAVRKDKAATGRKEEPAGANCTDAEPLDNKVLTPRWARSRARGPVAALHPPTATMGSRRSAAALRKKRKGKNRKGLGFR